MILRDLGGVGPFPAVPASIAAHMDASGRDHLWRSVPARVASPAGGRGRRQESEPAVFVLGIVAVDPRTIARVAQERGAATGLDPKRMGGHGPNRRALTGTAQELRGP